MTTFNYEAVKALLRCPKTGADLAYAGDALVCCDRDARLRYPIVDGFPVLLVDEAAALPAADWAAVMRSVGRDPETGRTSAESAAKG